VSNIRSPATCCSDVFRIVQSGKLLKKYIRI